MTTRRHALLAAALPAVALPAVAGRAHAAGATGANGDAGNWPSLDDIARRTAEVKATEQAFAKTLADRDAAAFKRFLAPDTIWMNDRVPLNGPDAVVAAWAKYFDGPAAPFAWAPDNVQVLPSGELALSSRPVTRPDGTLVARFQSIWRRKPAGGWEVVFDQGSDVCR